MLVKYLTLVYSRDEISLMVLQTNLTVNPTMIQVIKEKLQYERYA
jgi:hypothetical protein